MNVNEMLQQTGAIGAISRELGIDPATAEAGAAALMPLILSGFQSPAAATADPQAETAGRSGVETGGLGTLLGTIASMGGGGLLDNVTSSAPTDVGEGNQILGQIFGSKDGSRAVAAEAATQSGVEPSLLRKMLPILAMAAAGYLMKQAGQGQQGGGLGGMLGNMLGGQSVPPQGSATSQPAESSGILGDLIGAAGKFLGR